MPQKFSHMTACGVFYRVSCISPVFLTFHRFVLYIKYFIGYLSYHLFANCCISFICKKTRFWFSTPLLSPQNLDGRFFKFSPPSSSSHPIPLVWSLRARGAPAADPPAAPSREEDRQLASTRRRYSSIDRRRCPPTLPPPRRRVGYTPLHNYLFGRHRRSQWRQQREGPRGVPRAGLS